MNGFAAPTIPWSYLAPVVIVLGAGVLGIGLEALLPRRLRRPTQVGLALLATAAAVVAVAALWPEVIGGGQEVLGGTLVVDGPGLVLQGATALAGLIALLVIADRAPEDAFAASVAAEPGSAAEATSERAGLTQSEAFPLVLFSLGGMMIFPVAGDLLALFVALEVLSLPLYLLAGMARRRRLLSQEASLKYFLLSSFASAFFLFGVALLYGFAGSLRLADISAQTTRTDLDPLLLAGLVLLLVGFLFKVGAVPFHNWTPDVYQGAPTPVTGFMAACTKLAAFGAMLRVVYVVLPPLEWDLMPALWAIAALTMVVGTVIAVVQTDIKRMLAYSSISHVGFVLVGMVALNQSGITSVLFYLLAYAVATVGAFAVVWLVRETSAGGLEVVGEANHLTQWAGVGRRHPVLAGAFALFLLSFAGIPLTGGFVGKFAVFTAALEGNLAWLVVIGVLASIAAVFFYVRVIVLMFFTDPAGTAGENTVVVSGRGYAAVAIGVAAVATVVLGVLPSPVLDALATAASFVP